MIKSEKDMKLEELQLLKATDKGLPDGVTNEEWQELFEVLKCLVPPSGKSKMEQPKSYCYINGSKVSFQEETQWSRYCAFINSVLNTIRQGEQDYCYYIYQIKELLKYEHDNLAVTYLPEDECFCVYLINLSQKL
jgi:hypothetical protein